MQRRNRPLIERMIRAARLDANLYEEVERDTNATGQAATVVLIAAVAGGIATLLGGSIVGAMFTILGILLGWVAWSLITFWVGKTLFATSQTRVSPGEMLRTLGFAHTPAVLSVFGFIPIVGPLVAFVGFMWMVVAGVIAVRQAMDFTTGRAIGTVAVGLPAYLILAAIWSFIF